MLGSDFVFQIQEMIFSHYKMKLLLVISIFLLSCLTTMADDRHKVCINEIMQSNIDVLMTDYEYPDSWVEIYNGTDKAFDLNGCFIGNDQNYSLCYKLQTTETLPAGGHCLIYCDRVGNGMHTDFRLNSKKDALYLYDKNGVVIDALQYEKMPAPNIAFGRIDDGSEEWQYEMSATPGAKNTGKGASVVLPEPVFSIKGRIMNAPAKLVVSIPEGLGNDVSLHYTTDGSEPTTNSPCANGNSITIDIDHSLVVRAKLMSPTALSARSTTHSYIFHPRKTKMPIISIATDDIHLYSKENGGILIGDSTIEGTPNFNQDWRRPINIEHLSEGKETALFNQVCETAVSGNRTRIFDQKSMKFYTNKRFGNKYFAGPMWDEKSEIVNSKGFIMRNGGNQCMFSRFNDAMIQRLFGTHTKATDYQAYTPAIMYINGEYKGLYGLRERSQEHYVEDNYGLEEKDIEITDNWSYWYPWKVSGQLSVDLYNLYHDENTTYEQMCDAIDIENFTDVLIAEMFGQNWDYPQNNVVLWRPRAEGGKWRWIMKDLDMSPSPITSTSYHGFRMFDYMFLTATQDMKIEYKYAFSYDHYTESHRLYTKMYSFEPFRKMLADHMAVYLGDFLKPAVTTQLLKEMKLEIDSEVEPTFDTYPGMSSIGQYNASIEHTLNWYKTRPMTLYKEMAEYMNLGYVIPLEIIHGNTPVSINGLTLTEGDFDGAWASNQEMTLSNPGANNVWVISYTQENGTDGSIVIKDHNKPVILSQMSDNTITSARISIAETCNMVDKVNDVIVNKDTTTYSLSGVRLTNPQKGVNIVRHSDGSTLKTIHH